MTTTKHASSDEKSVDARGAADLLGVHIETVRRWEKAGLLKGWRTPGGYRRFALAEIRKLQRGGAK